LEVTSQPEKITQINDSAEATLTIKNVPLRAGEAIVISDLSMVEDWRIGSLAQSDFSITTSSNASLDVTYGEFSPGELKITPSEEVPEGETITVGIPGPWNSYTERSTVTASRTDTNSSDEIDYYIEVSPY